MIKGAPSSSPYLQDTLTVGESMRLVLYATVPGLFFLILFFGWGVVINMVLASIAAIGTEAAVLRTRKKPIWPALNDYSALVTAILLALAIPPSLPWWMTLLGAAFAILFAKQLYGGIGSNPFNPAMMGYVFLLIAFPNEMTAWLPAYGASDYAPLGFIDSIKLIFSGDYSVLTIPLDAVTMATPLDTLKTGWGLGQTTDEILNSHITFGGISGKGWSWVNAGFLMGGVLLVQRKLITWHIPASMLGGIFLLSSIGYVLSPDSQVGPFFHLFSGATMLGAFFIATDPVSAATSMRGKLYFGFGIGALTYIIRTWGGYPEGVAFAVLLMNLCVPLLDRYTKPRVYGHKRSS